MDGCTSVDRAAEAVPGRRIDDNEVFTSGSLKSCFVEGCLCCF